MPQRHQLSTIFQFTIEDVFENLETADVDMSTAHPMIETIVNRNFGKHFTTRMDQISVNTYMKTLVSSINPDPIKYQVPHQFHTLKKPFLGVDSTKKERDNC